MIRPIPLIPETAPNAQKRRRKRFKRPRGCVGRKPCLWNKTGPCVAAGCTVGGAA